MITKRAIAFDIGNKRIGVAISDPFNEYAMPCETYNRTGNFWADVTAIAKIAEDAGVQRIFIDMEYIGKADRQGGMDTVQNRHTIDDIKKISKRRLLPTL